METKGLFDLSKYTQQQQEQGEMYKDRLEGEMPKSLKTSEFGMGFRTGYLDWQIEQSAQANSNKKAFLCLYEGNRFFDSASSALDWIDTEHAKDRNKWYVVEITAEPVAQRLSDEQHAAELVAAYIRGAEMERKLMRFRLGRAIQEIIDESY